ncbi:MAG: hypothetical protein PHF17_02430 [Arcobacteraceae bacterium]|nr:hypothetical protein [Arcobacteraceae bacterium]
MILVSTISSFSTLYITKLQIESNQELTKDKIDSDFNTLKFNNEYKEKMERFSEYINSTLITDDIYDLLLNPDKVKELKPLDKIAKINKSYSNLIPYINENKIVDFDSINQSLITKLLSIYLDLYKKADMNSTKVEEYNKIRLKLIQNLKRDIIQTPIQKII